MVSPRVGVMQLHKLCKHALELEMIGDGWGHADEVYHDTCHVLWTMQLTGYLPDDDEQHPPPLYQSQ